jgi:hypothetical protein
VGVERTQPLKLLKRRAHGRSPRRLGQLGREFDGLAGQPKALRAHVKNTRATLRRDGSMRSQPAGGARATQAHLHAHDELLQWNTPDFGLRVPLQSLVGSVEMHAQAGPHTPSTAAALLGRCLRDESVVERGNPTRRIVRDLLHAAAVNDKVDIICRQRERSAEGAIEDIRLPAESAAAAEVR